MAVADNTPRNIAIVGAGASGTLTAVALSRLASARGLPLALHLVDARDIGRGVAYSTRDSGRLLNVPAGEMSAFGDQPDHFVRWLRGQGVSVEPRDFVSRRWYGTYLRDLLRVARARAGPGVALSSRVAAVERMDVDGAAGPLVLWLGAGRRLIVDAAVLAVGNPPPRPLDGVAGTRVVQDPWAPGALDQVGRTARSVVLVGTGLTMVDVALSLSRRCPGARFVAVSRGGLVPRSHSAEGCSGEREPVVEPRPGLSLDEVVATVRREIDRSPADWRAVVDSLRPVTPGIWSCLSLEDRRRFLRTCAREWEVHRHRTAPDVSEELRALRRSGRLVVWRGSLAGCVPLDRGGVVARIEHEKETDWLAADWVVNCTGPDLDLRRSGDRFVGGLIDAGRVRPHPLGLGLDVDGFGHVIDSGGRADPRLVAVGPLRRGALYESTAVPEIREQAVEVAEQLLAPTPWPEPRHRIVSKSMMAPASSPIDPPKGP